MKHEAMLQALEAAAQKKDIRITYEAIVGIGAGELSGGGLCKVKGEWRLIIDRRATPSERVAMVAGALAGFPLDDLFLPPEARELIDRIRRQRAHGSTRSAS